MRRALALPLWETTNPVTTFGEENAYNGSSLHIDARRFVCSTWRLRVAALGPLSEIRLNPAPLMKHPFMTETGTPIAI
jgi:hypothetical protein